MPGLFERFLRHSDVRINLNQLEVNLIDHSDAMAEDAVGYFRNLA